MLDLLMHVRTKPVDGPRRETNRRQFALDRFAYKCEGCRALAFCSVGVWNLIEQLAHSRKYREAVARKLLQTRFVRLRRILFLDLTVLVAVLLALLVVAIGTVRVDDG